MPASPHSTLDLPLPTHAPSPSREVAGSTPADLMSLDRRESVMRQAVGWALIALGFMGIYGVYWDIKWHIDVGRDRWLTPPHLMLYASTALRGLLCLAIVLWTTWRVKKGAPELNGQTTVKVLGFYGPLGIVVAGFGDLASAAAAPLDDYWHQLYGIDVSLWEPFHMMGLFGAVITTFGLLILLASEFNRAVARGELSNDQSSGFHPTQVAMMVGLLIALLEMQIVVIPAAQGSRILGSVLGVSVFVYPILWAIILPFGLGIGGLLLRSPLAATGIATAFVVARAFICWGVPISIETLRISEGLVYRPGAPVEQVLERFMPLTLPLAGLVVDAYRAWCRRTDRAISPSWLMLAAVMPLVLTWWPYLFSDGPRSIAARATLTSVPLTFGVSVALSAVIAVLMGKLLAGFARTLGTVSR